MCAGDRQAVRFGKFFDTSVVFFRRAETRREFRRRKKFMKIGAGRIVKLAQQFIQRRPIPERQTDGELNLVCPRQAAPWRQPPYYRRHVARQSLPSWFRAENGCHGSKKN